MTATTAPAHPTPAHLDFRPQPVDGMDTNFGASHEKLAKLMIPYKEIPSSFEDKRFWVDLQRQWFFVGLKPEDLDTFDTKPGIDFDEALAHLAAIQRSWAPKHEHKQDCIAYLMHLWFVKKVKA